MPTPIFFAHANGFPSATYGKLFAALAPDYRVLCLAQHAHDPRFPVNDNWSQLVDELLHHLRPLGEPVWGVGHSMGGVLHYHAALRQPELYRGLVLLDAPLPAPLQRLLLLAGKRLGLIDRLTPAGRTLGRRERFADRAEAHAYFAGKTLFRDFDPDCLQAYVEQALGEDDGGLRLRYDPAIEVGIYRSFPHRHPAPPQQLQVPLALVRGQQSRVLLPHQTQLVRRMRRGECLSLPGGHMFPLERPLATAELLKSLLGRWQQDDAEDSQ